MCERFNLLRTIQGVLKGVSELGLVIRVFSPTGQQQEPIISIVSIQLSLMQPTRVTAPLHPASLPPFNALPQGDCDKLYMAKLYIVSLHLYGILMPTILIYGLVSPFLMPVGGAILSHPLADRTPRISDPTSKGPFLQPSVTYQNRYL